MLSLVGLAWLIFCLIPFINPQGFLAGPIANLGYLVIGVTVMMAVTDKDDVMVMSADGTAVRHETGMWDDYNRGSNWRHWQGKDYPFIDDQQHLTYGSMEGHFFWDFHHPDSPNYISPRIWHPAAMVWIPALLSLPAWGLFFAVRIVGTSLFD